jgi:CHRD domain
VATTTPTFAGFPLGVTAGTYHIILDLTLATSWNAAFIAANGGTTAGAEAALAAGLNAGNTYLNIHTNVFPGGEIRGFLIPVRPTDSFQVRYAANLTKGDSVVNLTNAGVVNGLDPAGRICANVYTFDPNEELMACCSCVITPNGLKSLSARNDLIDQSLYPGAPDVLVIKLLADQKFDQNGNLVCNPSTPTAATLAPGLRAWGTTLHARPTTPVTYGSTETPFSIAELSVSELQKLTSYCRFIQDNGSGFGICNSCRTGGLGALSK